jgi:putative addiction module killer protein
LCYHHPVPAIREYLDPKGQSPFGEWFADLDAGTAARIRTALARLGAGNFSNVEPVGAGVSELKANFGPGYRVYFGQDGRDLVILLAGGTKQRQDRDIALAKARWNDYRHRKKGGT